MYRISQYQGAVASNPANEVNNIRLDGNGSEGVKPEMLIAACQKVDNSPSPELAHELSILKEQISDSTIKEKVGKLIYTLSMNHNPDSPTINPETQKPEPLPKEIASDIIDLVKNKKSVEKQMEPTAVVYNNRTAQRIEKKKKKTRGNPFRVLMGKIGKLLDHGVLKKDIVRFVLKDKIWDKETIEKAVGVVMEYNKKKERKKADSQNSKIVTSAFDYDTKPNYETRSTPELLNRLVYLLDLKDFTKTSPQSNGKEAPSKTGVSEEINKIKKALEDRDFDKEDMKKLGLGK
jgi:hypothetical protein